jgi:hypothetical protein
MAHSQLRKLYSIWWEDFYEVELEQMSTEELAAHFKLLSQY